MSNRKVSIIERVKRNGKWVWGEKWALPIKFTVKAESRQGQFYVVWYRGAKKVLTPVPQDKRPKASGPSCGPSARKNQTAASGGRGRRFAAP